MYYQLNEFYKRDIYLQYREFNKQVQIYLISS